jgi:hypothetical protein
MTSTEQPPLKRQRSEETVEETTQDSCAVTVARPVAKIFRPADYSFDTMSFVGEPSKNKMVVLVPIQMTDRKPILIQLSGGGRISPSFGVEEHKERPGRWNVTANVDCLEEHAALENMQESFTAMCCKRWTKWFPDQKLPSTELLCSMCNNFVTPRKKKKDSDGCWAGTFKAAVDTVDMELGRCKIKENNTGEVIKDLERVRGMTWTRIIFEVKFIYIQSTKSYGISKKLRFLEVCPQEADDLIVPL